MPGDRMQSRIMREFKSKVTKPFDLAKVTTIEDKADNERVQKQLGNGLHFTMEHAKPKKRALRTVTGVPGCPLDLDACSGNCRS